MLLTVGRMDSRERYKGHDLVIAALPALVAKGHDVAYVIIGDGDDRARLENLARDTGMSERVHFLGAVEPERLVEAYRMADLFVMPSTGEGFGIAFLEAMACGTPALGLGGRRRARCACRWRAWHDDLGERARRGHRRPARRKRRPILALSLDAVRARFGRELFDANAQLAIERLAEAA